MHASRFDNSGHYRFFRKTKIEKHMIIKHKNMGRFNPGFGFYIMYLFFLSYLLKIIQYTTAQPSYIYHFCYGDNYTTGSKFEANLNRLFPSILSFRYNNTTVGQIPDTVYGSIQCRGDVSLDTCQSCVNFGIQDINIRCPNSRKAIIWYRTCMLRYSNEYYFNIMQITPEVYLRKPNNISNPEQLTEILVDLMNELGKQRSSFSNFATGDKNLTNGGKVYGLVQCSPDLPSSDCSRCLSGAISVLPNCCYGKQGARVIRPSCNIRYELYPFLQLEYTNVPSPPLVSFPVPLPSPPPLILLAPFVSPPTSKNTATPIRKGNSILAISTAIPSVIVVISAISFWCFCFQRRREYFDDVDGEMPITEFLQFNFGVVSAATNNFSQANKLGEGGFGSVYKGTLPDRLEIAVKRLSENSEQGDQEFKNEVTLVAKLQHKNLVKLVGFSLAGEEKLLMYEFMPNASLDQFLFDPIKCTQLDWEIRYKIIGGIAKGLHYLHEESRLKIVHRDLKASNILLDKDMNPKIADFGMARLFVFDQTQAITNRIVGTYGYMAPEYIMHGEFSVKSDVFSFGVLVLEILCGQRNSSFHKSDIDRDLLSYAWRHWNSGSSMEILDSTLKDACSESEAMRCIHAALLCVQENAAERPSMPTIVLMLNNSVTSYNVPSSPAFFTDSSRHIEPHSRLYLGYSEDQMIRNGGSSSKTPYPSVNDVSVTELYRRSSDKSYSTMHSY